MKLKALQIKDFRGIVQAGFVFDRPVTMILGENGVGKSSVGDALEMLFLGACQHTGRGGQGYAALIRAGAQYAAVEAEVEISDTTYRLRKKINQKSTSFEIEGFQGPSSDQERTFFQKAGISPAVLRAVLRVSGFLEEPKTRIGLLLDAAGVSVEPLSVVGALKQLGNTDDPAFIGRVADMIHEGKFGTLEGLEGLTKAGKLAEAGRKAANEKIKATQAVLETYSKGVEIPPTKSGRRFAASEGEAARIEHIRLKEQRDSALVRIGKLKGELEAPPVEPVKPAPIESWRRMLAELEGTENRLVSTIEAITLQEKCKVCGEKLHKASRDRLSRDADEALSACYEERNRLQDLIRTAPEPEEPEPVQPNPEAEKALAELERLVSKLNGQISQIAEIVRAIDRESDRINMVNKAKATLETEKADGAFWQRAVELFRDGGISGRLVNPVLERFDEVVSHCLDWFGLQGTAGLDGSDLFLGLKEPDRESDRYYDIRLGSSSEKLRAQIAILEAFAAFGNAGGLGFIDNIEIFSCVTRTALMGYLDSAANIGDVENSPFESLILAGSWTREDPPGPIEGAGLYYWPTQGASPERIE